MARPKMTVDVAIRMEREKRYGAVTNSTEPILFPAGARAKQTVKFENGTVLSMRAKIEATTSQEDHSGVEDAAGHSSEDKVNPQEAPSPVVVEGAPGASSPVKVESVGDDDVAGSNLVQDVASEQDAVIVQGKLADEKCAVGEQFVCTACGRSVSIFDSRAHPVLHVGVCKKCYDFLFSSPFTKDNPQDPFEHENECRWCGDGGEVILCDICPKAFCKPCIKRNFGEEILNSIESPVVSWSCFVCDDEPLETLVRDYNNVEKLMKTMDRFGQPQKSRSSRDSNPRKRSRGRLINNATSGGDSIATIIAREKARKYPGNTFTGFEDTRTSRRRPHIHSLTRRNTNLELGTSESGEPIPEVHLEEREHGTSKSDERIPEAYLR